MARSHSRLFTELDFARDGKQTGFIRLPHSVHRSAYGWIPIPVACIKNGAGPRVFPHDTPWREPATAAFGRGGTVICKRVPGRVERGDCLYHLADDFVP